MKQCISKIKYSIAFLAAVLMIMCMSISVSAQETGKFQMIGKYDLENVIFSLYKIGNRNESNEIVPIAEYADYQINYSDNHAPQTLEAYIQRNQLNPLIQTKTNQNGIFQFSDMPEGVYLISGESTESNGKIYFPSPAIFMVSDDSPMVEIVVKSTFESVKQNKDISVLKVWDDNHSKNRPSEISVDLLKDGNIYDTVKLSRNNNWQYQWKGLDGSCQWHVTESNVPKNYTVNISSDSGNFIITNTISKTVTPQSTPEKLPQTGQMNLPVIILFSAGLILIIIGMIRRKYSDSQHQT